MDYTKFLKIVSSSNKKPAKANMNGPQVGCDDPDPRGNNTTDNLVKNKLRLMGLKMSYEPEGEVLEDYMRVNSDGSRERVAGDPPKAKLKRKPLDHTPEQKRQMNKQPKTKIGSRFD